MTEKPNALQRYRVGDIVRYVGNDPRWVGQQGPVTRADYDSHASVPLVVDLPGGPKGIGICFAESHVEMIAPATLTLTEFLLARIAEDEEWNRDNPGGDPMKPGSIKRTHAECEAKRRIVGPWVGTVMEDGAWALRVLATIHADHPDFREEWRA